MCMSTTTWPCLWGTPLTAIVTSVWLVTKSPSSGWLTEDDGPSDYLLGTWDNTSKPMTDILA